MNVPFLDLKAQYSRISNEVNENIRQVLEKCNFVMGEEVRRFEEKFAAYCGVRFGIGVANGTDAIHLAMRAAGGPAWDGLIARGMAVDFDWLRSSAPQYVEMYERAIALRRGRA